MYNFLDPKLLPKVATITGSLEGYEPSNLISENPLTKSRGFLAYSCIKPPIDIDFELICPICVHYIAVTCKLGTQRTVGVEVQAKNDGPEFTTIAHGYFNEDIAVFCNLRYYTRTNPPKTGASVYLGFFKGHLFRVFTKAKYIRVRILRTERSTPCLGPVEIWGRVAKSCPKITAETVVKLMSKKPPVETLQAVNSNPQLSGFEICEDFKDALTFEIMAIPMTLPSGHSVDQSTVERCAGNDATYGRRCCDPFTGLPFTESRKPKLNVALKNRIDMFLLQNAHRKETFGISRTVGSKFSVNKQLESDSGGDKRLQVVSNDSMNGGFVKIGCSTSNANYCSKRMEVISKVLKDDEDSQNVDDSFNYSRNNEQSTSKDISRGVLKGDKLDPSKDVTKDPFVNYPKNVLVKNNKDAVNKLASNSSTPEGGVFQDNKLECTSNSWNYHAMSNKRIKFNSNFNTSNDKRLTGDCDLDEAIAKVMNSSGFVTFTKQQDDGDGEIEVRKCCVCGDCSNLYGLPCAHLYCRACLLDVCKTLICKDCDDAFCRNDVKKIHG